jgi:hypothetical protein
MNTTIISLPRKILLLLAITLAAIAATGVARADTTSDDPRVIIAQIQSDPTNNVAAVFNDTDNAFLTDGSITVDYEKHRTVDNINVAYAQSQCTACSSMAVAFELVLYDDRANNVSPENGAFAVNINCTNCFTYARAVQYALPVEHPKEVAEKVEWRVEHLNDELQQTLFDVSHGSIDTTTADQQIEGLVTDFTAIRDAIAAGQTDEEHEHDFDNQREARTREHNEHVE